jgi:hypothetical protein
MGQGALRSRSSAGRMSSAISILQRLTQCEHSGRSLGGVIHQHYGYRLHCTWDGAFGNRSIEQRFGTYDSNLGFCTTVAAGGAEGLGSCISAREGFFYKIPMSGELLYGKNTMCNKRCRKPEMLPIWFDRPWFTIREERRWQW